MAWFAVLHLVFKNDVTIKPRRADFVIGVTFCLFVFFTDELLYLDSGNWGRGLLVSFEPRCLNLRSAAIVLGALSVQELWGHVLFHLFEYPLLSAETAVVGSLPEVIRAGTVWQGNVVTAPNGYGIVIYEWCSAFHNLSLAMLCSITISNLQ
jgi:hypothetical protein